MSEGAGAGAEEVVAETTGTKRRAGWLSRGVSGDGEAERRPQARGRPLPGSEVVKMRSRVKISSCPFRSGYVTWRKKSKNDLCKRGGSGVPCADVEAVYLKLWELYGYHWEDEVP